MGAEFERQSEAGTQVNTGGFRTAIQTAADPSDIDLESLRVDIENQIDRFTKLASGWTLVDITKFTLHVAKYRPLVGSSYIETPKSLFGKRAIVNVENSDDECFKWAVLSALYPASTNTQRIKKCLGNR